MEAFPKPPIAFRVSYRPQGNYAVGLKRSLRIEMEQLKDRMREAAVALTSGTVSTAQLRRMGHPFSRRRPGSLARLPINKQTGRLQRSLRVMRRTVRGSEGFQLQFMARYSVFVLRPKGTKRMVARGFWAKMRERYRDAVRRFKPRLV